MLPPVRSSVALATYTALFVPLPVRRVLLRTTSAAPFRAPRSAHPVPWMTQLSTMKLTPDPDARIGPPVDWMVAPLHKIVLLADNANSVIVYPVFPSSVTVVPSAARSGARGVVADAP